MDIIIDDMPYPPREFFLHALAVAERIDRQLPTHFFQDIKFLEVRDIEVSLEDRESQIGSAIDGMYRTVAQSFGEINPYELPADIQLRDDDLGVYIKYLMSRMVGCQVWQQTLGATEQVTGHIVQAIQGRGREPT